MNNIAVKIDGVSKKYKLYEKHIDRVKEALSPFRKAYGREFYALDDISFDIMKGETLGIIGKNGSGKSTILKIITGVLTPSSGSVSVDGKISALLELGTGFNMDFTGIDNIYLNGTIMGYSNDEMKDRIQNIIEFADIGDFINQPVKSYSSGMFVRLAFAVAINVDPDILIIDEALAVGDTRFQLKCIDKFNELRKVGKTVIFVSHDINSIKRFCNRVVWLNGGKLMQNGETDLISDMYSDYIKSLDVVSSDVEENEPTIKDRDSSMLASIEKVEIRDPKGFIIKNVLFGQDLIVKVDYFVENDTIKKPVLGIAIRSIDNFYVCGLNTLLDDYNISWKKGKNTCTLKYEKFNLIGGSYYFDVAIFDGTATVAIDYQAKKRTFFVESAYVGEGVVILNHKWM